MSNIKILKALFSFLGGMVLAGVIVYGINVEKNKTLSKAYVYEGFADYSIEELGDSFFSKPMKLPSSISLHDSITIVQKPETAAKIGILILSSKYGKNFVAGQYPFEVFLVNGKFWLVKGSERNNLKSSSLYMQRADSKILKIER